MIVKNSEKIRVFVYGTLMKGEYNHHLIADGICLGEAATFPEYELADLGSYPAMIQGGGVSVMGELYIVNSRILANLDALEGHPEYYHRVTISLPDGAKAQTYLMPEERVRNRPRIESGNWRSGRTGTTVE